jgi:hypothetical protein
LRAFAHVSAKNRRGRRHADSNRTERPLRLRRDHTSVKHSDVAMGMDVPLVSDNVDLVINAGFEAE